jgi:NADPH:quinone reductase
MKAVQATRFGEPTVLELVELPDPTPGPGEIAIDVTHAAVGLIDLFFREGRFKDQPAMPQPPFVPGLEVTGTVRALGDAVSGFEIGEKVVSMSNGGIGGYASIFIAQASLVVSLTNHDINPALAVSVVPNAAMAHVALTCVAHLAEGESVLIHGALGGFAAAFPGMAKHLGAGRVVGTVRTGKLQAAATTKLPYDKIVDSAELPTALGAERFDVVIDPVGAELRSQSLDLMRPGGRLIAVGNASGDWGHSVDTNRLWIASVAVMGFNAGAYLPTHPHTVRPALEAAVQAVTAGLGQTEVDVLPFSEAVTAHQRMASRTLNGRIALTPAEPA